MKYLLNKGILINRKSRIFINCFSCILLFFGLFISPTLNFAQNIPNNPECRVCQELFTYPQLASLNSDDGKLTQLILGQLIGSEINLTALNWQGVTQADVTLLEYLTILQSIYGISSPSAVLDAELTMVELIDALIIVADNNGTIAFLNEISTGIGPGTIKLGDLITANTVNGDLIDINFDLLSLVTGMIQLYNYDNVLVTNAPIALDLGPLGVAELSAQVVEPPHFVCGVSDSTYFSAGIRLKVDLDIIDEEVLDTVVIVDLLSTSITASLEKISLYIDVARGEVTFSSINSITNESVLEIQPGLVRVFLGHINNMDFFSRTADSIMLLTEETIGSINIEAIGLSANLDIDGQAFGDASNGIINFSEFVPFDSIIGSNATAISELGSDLSSSSLITISSQTPILGLLLEIVNLVKDDIISNTNDLLFVNNNGKINNLIIQVVDPLLKASGIGIGQVSLKSENINEKCYDYGDAPSTYKTTLIDDGARHLIDGDIYLGANPPQPNIDGNPVWDANYDVNDDGLISFDPAIVNNEYKIQVSYNNTTSDSAMIIAWLDFDNDGSFNVLAEQSINSSVKNVAPNSSGSIELVWDNIPLSSDIIDRMLRIRISSDDNLKNPSGNRSNGLLLDGEVEDYLIQESVLGTELLYFDVEKQSGQANLYWVTDQEINFHGYSVERSSNGYEFHSIGWINGSKEGGIQNEYRYLDKDNATSGTIYYRLKMIDLDNSFEYSEVKSINLDLKSKSQALRIYPNPVNLNADLIVDTHDQVVSFRILDINGNTLKDVMVNKKGVFSISLYGLNSGLYVIQFVEEYGRIENKRVVVF